MRFTWLHCCHNDIVQIHPFWWFCISQYSSSPSSLEFVGYFQWIKSLKICYFIPRITIIIGGLPQGTGNAWRFNFKWIQFEHWGIIKMFSLVFRDQKVENQWQKLLYLPSGDNELTASQYFGNALLKSWKSVICVLEMCCQSIDFPLVCSQCIVSTFIGEWALFLVATKRVYWLVG